MKKFTTILAILMLGSFLVAGNAMAIPSEWGIVSPNDLSGTPTYTPGTDFGYFIWTDDDERYDWHIRWSGDGPDTYFQGFIVLENNVFDGDVTEIQFESHGGGTTADVSNGGGSGGTSVNWLALANVHQDGLDFSIVNTESPGYVGFDLFYGSDEDNITDADSHYIFLGPNEETVFSLGEDQDFALYAPVPEPATMLLLGTGLIGLAAIGRKRFLKKQ